MKESVFARLVSGLFGIWFVLVGLSLTGCAAWSYVSRNCRVETEVGSKAFICVVCDFNNASEALKKKLEKRIDEIGRPGK